MKLTIDSEGEIGICEQCGSFVDPDALTDVTFGTPEEETVIEKTHDDWDYNWGYLKRALEEAESVTVNQMEVKKDTVKGEVRRHFLPTGLGDEPIWHGELEDVDGVVVQVELDDNDAEWCDDCVGSARDRKDKIERLVENERSWEDGGVGTFDDG